MADGGEQDLDSNLHCFGRVDFHLLDHKRLSCGPDDRSCEQIAGISSACKAEREENRQDECAIPLQVMTLPAVEKPLEWPLVQLA